MFSCFMVKEMHLTGKEFYITKTILTKENRLNVCKAITVVYLLKVLCRPYLQDAKQIIWLKLMEFHPIIFHCLQFHFIHF